MSANESQANDRPVDAFRASTGTVRRSGVANQELVRCRLLLRRCPGAQIRGAGEFAGALLDVNAAAHR